MGSIDSTNEGRSIIDRKHYFSAPPKGILLPKPNERKLSVGIIGAGIAGLSAAIGLSKSGHNVEIFERSRFNNEVGAAINCCPNATRILRYWDFDFNNTRPNDFGQGRFMKGDDLSTFLFNDHSHWEERYGAPGYFLHRVDLHNGLRDVVQRSPSHGEGTTKIRLSTAVEAIDVEAGSIKIANGELITKDVIVIADGVHSPFVERVTGNETAALQTGTSAFRFLIPTERLLQNEETKPLFEGEPSSIRAAVLGDTRIVWYPCRNSTLQNGIVMFPTSLLEDSSVSPPSTTDTAATQKESWDNSASISSLLSVVRSRGFHPSLIAFCAMAEDLRLWPLLYRPPIANWFKGRAVLVGDAAHPMLPHQGQAGAQAIEDGLSLSIALSHLPSSTSPSSPPPTPSLSQTLTHRLTLFQRIRRPRAAAMQIFSNAGQDSSSKAGAAEEARQYLRGDDDGKKEEEVMLPKTPAEFHEWNFGWDCWRESVGVVKREGIEGFDE